MLRVAVMVGAHALRCSPHTATLTFPATLLCAQAHDHEGFHILNAIVEFVPLPAYEQFLPTLFQLLFSRCGCSGCGSICI